MLCTKMFHNVIEYCLLWMSITIKQTQIVLIPPTTSSGLDKRRYKKKNNRFLTNYENQYMIGNKYYYWDYHKNNVQDLTEWNVVDVLMWLIESGRDNFVQYQHIFWNKRIDGKKLKTLKQIDLFNLGVNDKNDCTYLS